MLGGHPAERRSWKRRTGISLVSKNMPVKPAAHGTARALRTEILLGLGAIYLIWGSTYLGIRYAVETIPPLLMMAIRHSTAGLVVFAWARRKTSYSRAGRIGFTLSSPELCCS